jgi:hypothetical protein
MSGIEGPQPNEQVMHRFNALSPLPTPSIPYSIEGAQQNENAPQLMHGFTNVLPTPEHMSGIRDVPSLDLGLSKFNSSHHYDASFGGDESLYMFPGYNATSNLDGDLSSVSSGPSIHAPHFTSATQHLGTTLQMSNPITSLANSEDAPSTTTVPSVNHTTVCDANFITADYNNFGNASLDTSSGGYHSTTLNISHAPANIDTDTPISAIDPTALLNTNGANTFEPPITNTPSPASILQNAGNALRRSGRPVVPTEKVAQLNSGLGKENKTGSDRKGTKRGGRGGAGTRPSKRVHIEG